MYSECSQQLTKVACWNHLNSLSHWQILHPALSHSLASRARRSPKSAVFLSAHPCRSVPALWVMHGSCLLIWHSAMGVRCCVCFPHIYLLFVLLDPYWHVSLNAVFRDMPKLNRAGLILQLLSLQWPLTLKTRCQNWIAHIEGEKNPVLEQME